MRCIFYGKVIIGCTGECCTKVADARRRKVDGGSDSPIQVRHALAKGVGLAGVHPARIRLVRRKIAGAGRLRYCTSRAASLVEGKLLALPKPRPSRAHRPLARLLTMRAMSDAPRSDHAHGKESMRAP